MISFYSRTKLHLIFVICFLLISGCGRVIMTIYGIRKPKIESSESLVKYCNKKSIIDTNIYSVSYEDFLEASKLTSQIPGLLVFDNNGFLVPHGDSLFCVLKTERFLDSLLRGKKYKSDTSININHLPISIKKLNGEDIGFIGNNNNNYIALICWTRWTGRLNIVRVKSWEERISTYKYGTFKTMKLNLDFREYWNKTNEECYKLIENRR